MMLWKGWGWDRSDVDMLSIHKAHEYYKEGDTHSEMNLAISWRRCHSRMVWQAIQAVVAMATTLELVERVVADVDSWSGANRTATFASEFDMDAAKYAAGWRR